MTERNSTSTDRELFIGIDIGGTRIKSGVGARASSPAAAPPWIAEPIPTGAGPADAIRAAVDGAMRHAADEGGTVAAIGVGIPGMIDPSGLAHEVVNIPGWAGIDVAELLADHGVPVVTDNDANVALLGEVAGGGAHGVGDVLLLTLGTGVGGAILSAGRVVRGVRGGGGEIGHLPTPYRARRCGCGEDGCLETWASGTGMRKTWAESGANWEGRTGDALEVPALLRAARDGDTDALRAIDHGLDVLAHGVASSLALLNSELVLIGGGVVEGYPDIVGRFEARLREVAPKRVLDGLRVAAATLGNDAGVRGAIELAARRRDGMKEGQ